MADAVSILKDLVSIPSVNPMGRDRTGPEYFEGRLTEHLAGFMKKLGVEFQVIEVVPGRANVIARIDRPGASKTVLLDAHQDTVPIDGMTIEPFNPVVKDGRLYGRGACDVKGGMASMLAAFARLAKDRPAGPNVVMTCTCDEESTSLGINDLTKLWSDPNRKGTLLSKAPDVAIVAEPTDLDIVVAHRGATRWKVRTEGRACHSSQPSEGINAIYRMAKILTALDQYADLLPSLVKPHPLCGSATLSVGRIEGGISVNTVPDWCEIEIDRRVVPGEDGWQAMHDVENFLRSHVDVPFSFLPPWIVGATLPDDTNGPLADALMKHITAVVGPRRKMGVPYGTHASRTYAAGVTSVVFGPGSISKAHTVDEWVPIDELEKAAEVYYRYCADPANA